MKNWNGKDASDTNQPPASWVGGITNQAMAYLAKFDPTLNDWRTNTNNTMNTKHTPGPWEVDRFYWTLQRRLFGPDEPEVEVLGRLTNGENAEANARLIAAAPDLLEALQDAVNAWDNGDLDTAIIRRLRDAIAKATNL